MSNDQLNTSNAASSNDASQGISKDTGTGAFGCAGRSFGLGALSRDEFSTLMLEMRSDFVMMQKALDRPTDGGSADNDSQPGEVLYQAQALHQNLEAAHPHWFDELAALDLASISTAGLAKVINTAPHPFAMGMVQAWLTLRPYGSTYAAPFVLHRDDDDEQAVIQARSLINEAYADTQSIASNWLAQVDSIGLDTCPRDELLSLLKCAPNDFAQGLVYGKYVARLVLSQVHGPWL